MVTTTPDLWRWVDALTQPQRHRLHRENGTVEHLTLPCLLDQLEADLSATGSDSGRGGKPGSRPPVNVTVLSLLGEMDAVLSDAITGEGLTRRDTLAGKLRAIAAHIAGSDPDVLEWWTGIVRGWTGDVRACLPEPEEGGSTRLIRGMPCPTCRTWTIERTDGTDVYRDPALVLVFNNRYVRYALCRACGENWARGDRLIALADTAGMPAVQERAG